MADYLTAFVWGGILMMALIGVIYG